MKKYPACCTYLLSKTSLTASLSIILTAMCLLFPARLIVAQNATGSITGLVADPTGAVIANAIVTVTSKATGAVRKTTTGAEGNYSAENLVPGDYEIKVEMMGFSSQILALTVQVGNTATGNFSLTIGAANQTIEVMAGGAPILNTSDSGLGGVVTQKQIESLPLNGRSFLSVAALEPGVTVTYQATSGVLNQNDFFQVGVGGAPSYMTTISVDGARANDRITGGTSQNFSSETVQEFQISTIGFDLSTGTVSSGAVNVISRGGSNNFHGSTFLYFRDHNMAAFTGLRRPCTGQSTDSPLCNNAGTRKRLEDPFFVRKQYGGTIGGPIKKNKLFFFANYERSDQVGAQQVVFSDPLLFGYNHVAKVPFDQHLIGTRIDYTVNQKHTAFLRGNIDKNDSISGTGMESNWIGSSNFSYQTQLGITSVLTPRLVNDFRFSYSYFRNRLYAPSQKECESLAGDPRYCVGVGSTLISFFGGLSIGNNANVPQDRHPRTYQYTDNVSMTLGTHRLRFGANWEHIFSHGSWNRNFAGTFGVFNPATIAATNPTLYASLPASLKLGYTGPVATFAELLQLPMTGALTIGIGDPIQPVKQNFDSLARNNHIRLYVQDGWQIRKNFTLNYGLGWSWEDNIVYHDYERSPYLKALGIQSDKVPQDYNNFDPAVGFAWSINDKTVIRSSVSLHHTSANRSYLKLQDQILNGPAGIGLTSSSSSSLGNPKLGANTSCNPAVAGTCINFATAAATNLTGQEMVNYLATLRGILGAQQARFNGQDLSIRNIDVRKQAPTYLSEAVFDKNFRTPYTIHVNAGVQRQIRQNLSVSADYVMRRGVKFGAYEGYMEDINRWNRFSGYSIVASSGVNVPVRNPVLPVCSSAQALDPKALCSTNIIYYGSPSILSRYSALQVKVDKRFSQGFMITGAYALQRYTTYAPANGATPNSFTDSKQNFGLTGASPKQQFTFSGIWELPRFTKGNRLTRGMLNGWQLSTIWQMRSHDINTVQMGTFDPEGDGTFVYLLPGTKLSSFGRGQDVADVRKLVAAYNASVPASKDTPLQQIGRDKRDAIGAAYPFIVLPDNFSSGDSFIAHDLRLTRTIAITEKIKLNLIAEGFNVLNIANLGGFSGSLASAAYIRPVANSSGVITTAGRPNPNNLFGQATSRVSPIFGTGGPRAFQFAARLSF
ncbi:MAG: carboxypeptidase regulatory-like domain-containing protein [Acidobacteria bacterium]|nr:carboxypeptidase regulatory-like domain-containing protein [Acidobacteriota bacterium]